jgi:hypothetical protein
MYDIKGKPTLQSILTQKQGDTCCYTFGNREDCIYYLNSNYHLYFKDEDRSYSSDGKTATINYPNLSYTYDFKKEQITIINCTSDESDLNVVVKNGIAEYTVKKDMQLEVDGCVYLIKNGSKGQFKCEPIPMSKNEFGKHFNTQDYYDEWGSYLTLAPYPILGNNISLSDEHVKNKFKDSIIG